MLIPFIMIVSCGCWICCIAMTNYVCRIITTQRWATQVFRKIYLSLYLKGFERVTKGFTVWEVSWRLNRTATYWPPLMAITTFLSRSPGLLNQGAWGPSLSGTWSSFQHLLSNLSELQLLNQWPSGPSLLGAGSLYRILSPTNLNFLCTELYYCFTPHSIQPVDNQGYPLDTFDRMHLLFTQVHFLFWQLGRGQYATNTLTSSLQRG